VPLKSGRFLQRRLSYGEFSRVAWVEFRAAGLAVLAREFEWARCLLNRVKAIANRIAGALH
jgi:hypothetical protein